MASTTHATLFNMPMGFFQFQGASNRFDFAVWGHMQNGIIEPVSLVAAGNVYTCPTSLRFPRSENGNWAWRSRCTTPPIPPRP